ncbi:MAG: Omp28-related outer membrane protein [Weeksellaceae bacterium]
MKKITKHTHILILLLFIGSFIVSCGTEEDVDAESLELTLSTDSIPVGSPISFQLNSSIAGNVSGQAQFFVNGEQIDGSVYTPQEVRDDNTVYATYNGQTSESKTFASIPVVPSAYTQKVLIEDYTGTWCGYCPRMVTILHYLTASEYSDRIVPVAIHCPGAPTDPWVYEFALDMTMPDNYNAMGQPKGKINRIYDLDQMQGSYPCPSDADVYLPQLLPYLNQTAALGLGINSTRNGNNLEINVKVGFATDDLPNAKLVVNLIEDGLNYNQVNYYAGGSYNCDSEYNYSQLPNPIPNFPQEHVLLKSYTDIYGDDIPQGQISQGNVWQRNFSVQLPDNVSNPNNLKLVAFVLGNGDQIKNREVINVQIAPVGVNQDFD